MAVTSRHLAASLRLVDNASDTIHSYHSIRPNIQAPDVENFLQGVNNLRLQTGGNAFLTITTELVDEGA